MRLVEADYALKLKACNHLSDGRQLHWELARKGLDSQKFLGNHIIQMFGRLGSLDEARAAFERLCWRNVFSWTIMVALLAQNGYLNEAGKWFWKMPEHSAVSCNAVMVALADSGNIAESREMFDKMAQRDVASWNSMVSAYAQSGDCLEASSFFSRMPVVNVVSWTALLSGLSRTGQLQEAKFLFDKMPERNIVSWNALITANAQAGDARAARALFDRIPARDSVSWNSIFPAYTRTGMLEEARRLFQSVPCPNSITWTSMLFGYAEAGDIDQARKIFLAMDRDAGSWNALIAAYGQGNDLESARLVFEKMAQWNIRSWTSMFLACSQMAHFEETRRIFDGMPERDLVSWNAMLTCYTRSERAIEALELFKLMTIEGVRPNGITFLCLIDACSQASALTPGILIDEEIGGSRGSVELGNSFISMYAKCGSFENAKRHFDAMEERDSVSWTAMITADVQSGNRERALQLFVDMIHQGVDPHDVTFLGVLSACAYEGLLERGCELWTSMAVDFGIAAKAEHYAWLVNLLARSGRLVAAEELIDSMPYHPDHPTWGALLGACSLDLCL
ncbi:pentatricopeptide repeat-containing protein At4g02750-like [Selaginella moellendorffii]|uniref:pentatricopeptide repeat-containing protein At4g02750-like n=1 Tax=Selaginella moellendorffii TaxID=88036 RepID=UPI000D1C89A6|nr:pentatricopeptide repeat-containing protein At4g02750-like [Selaginella moellendorffii]|eukprot:XP_024532932.1 pentatricopeptide repeat-containing protein At4g02750-like [Selaginella moellendorffii]